MAGFRPSQHSYGAMSTEAATLISQAAGQLVGGAVAARAGRKAAEAQAAADAAAIELAASTPAIAEEKPVWPWVVAGVAGLLAVGGIIYFVKKD